MKIILIIINLICFICFIYLLTPALKEIKKDKIKLLFLPYKYFNIEKRIFTEINEITIMEKLKKELTNLCEKNNIKLLYKNQEYFNAYYPKTCGVFKYNPNKVNKNLEIFILKDQPEKLQIWTLAHELGHYYNVIQYNDLSEKAANNYIQNLCFDILSPIELLKIDITISVYSCLSLNLNKNQIFIDYIQNNYPNDKKFKKILKLLKNYNIDEIYK